MLSMAITPVPSTTVTCTEACTPEPSVALAVMVAVPTERAVTVPYSSTVADGTGVMAIESIPPTAEIYSLTGMRVLKPSRGSIYIIGGTKVLVR